MKESHDGRSPDAQCIEACYVKSISQLDSYPGLLLNSSWKDAMVGTSFDGASVMMGTQNGTAARLKRQINGYSSTIHAVAHVQQLADADAFDEVDFFKEWRQGVQEVRL